MKRRVSWLVLLLAAGAVVGLLLASRRLDAESSSLSRGATGWLAARLYLEHRGAAPEVLDHQLAADGGGTLVL
ncbi:MAG TPA: hypothetical protein VFS60_11790, partial [Thermoanaerobaculia bacterium]|nr:hypothetical protein [Thermoanaerobaculia bacterium]